VSDPQPVLVCRKRRTAPACVLVVRPSGQVRPADLAPVTRNADVLLSRDGLSWAFRAPGFAPAVRALRAPDNGARYRPPGRSARGDARLSVAAVGEEAASVTRREGLLRSASRCAPSRRLRAFRAASLSRRALAVTALRQPGPRVLACVLTNAAPLRCAPWTGAVTPPATLPTTVSVLVPAPAGGACSSQQSARPVMRPARSCRGAGRPPGRGPCLGELAERS
jgi:hypothetical protein